MSLELKKQIVMEQIIFWLIVTLLAWAVERSADALLDLILEWIKRQF